MSVLVIEAPKPMER